MPELSACVGSAPFTVTTCPVVLDPEAAGLQGVEGSFPSSLRQIFMFVGFPPRVVSQPSCEPSDLKSSLLFKAFFLAPGHT